ncbi:MAG: tetratricopeptide repeat protein [Gammaproteobacteria bacterium]
MKTITLGMILLITTTAAGANDVWQTLFKEKFQEAMQGNSNAQFDIGSMYQNGRGVSPNRREAIEWYKKAAAQNNEMAVSRLNLLQANEERFDKALASTATGDMESQYKLGNMYTEGVGTNIDLTKAAEAFEQSASQGYAKAEYKLGLIYYEGTGVTASRKTAYKWFKKAADKGYAAAQYYLGKMYASGEGVKRDYATSLEWYTKAVDGGFNQARSEMIDVSEKINAPKTTSAAPAKKAVARKPATVVRANKKFTRSKTFGIEDLMVAAWSRDGEPVAYLPSAINNCRTEKHKIACYSDDQMLETADSVIRFKTKSLMRNFSSDGSFDVTYRNLVIDTTQMSAAESAKEVNEIGSVATAPDAYTIKTGWGKEHTLECRMIEESKVSCLKNKTHSFLLVSPQTVASGN